MTDYGEEQRNELEALESIYPDSFTGDFSQREPRGGRAGAAGAPGPPWLGWGRDGLRVRSPRRVPSPPSSVIGNSGALALCRSVGVMRGVGPGTLQFVWN